MVGSSSRGTFSSSSCSAVAARARDPGGVLDGLGQQAREVVVAELDPGGGQARPHRVGVDVTLGGFGEIVGLQVRRDVAVDDDRADRQPQLL